MQRRLPRSPRPTEAIRERSIPGRPLLASPCPPEYRPSSPDPLLAGSGDGRQTTWRPGCGASSPGPRGWRGWQRPASGTRQP
uniref:Uncharacterized protein n=1 Tax=Rangifer tarandus platyrhynchus TaxID=3082113 RepID=A0ACB0FHZ6_RANTA|nr:unnamed protein product [Rangifer tarandus platyrhynchus]